jgi:hypothetical protein
MTKEERELLLLLTHWMLGLESGVATKEEKRTHPGLKRLSELIAAVEREHEALAPHREVDYRSLDEPPREPG